MPEYTVKLRRPHPKQKAFIDSTAKRKVIRAGRRGGKTTGIAIDAVKSFLSGKRVLYGTPTQEQVDAFWYEVTGALRELIDARKIYKNESRHLIEFPNTKNRIRAKTAWNADTLRGDYGDKVILDEFQLMQEDVWDSCVAPMMLDTNGDTVFIFTPPSLKNRTKSRANDPTHASKLFKKAQADTTGRWATFHFSSLDNPYLSREALDEITTDMTALAYRTEILALDDEEMPGALWKRAQIDADRLTPDALDSIHLSRVVVAIDPATSSAPGADEHGIIVAGRDPRRHGYVLEDVSTSGSPGDWARAAIKAYDEWEADAIVVEVNNGGEMCEHVLRSIREDIRIISVHASRGKAVRAEPVAARSEKHEIHHVGTFPDLEDQLCGWTPDMPKSPDRLDAMVWGFTELLISGHSDRTGKIKGV